MVQIFKHKKLNYLSINKKVEGFYNTSTKKALLSITV